MAGLLDFLQLSHHGFWWELFSLASAGLAIALLVVAIVAYRRHRLRRLLPLSIAFSLFAVKVGLLHLDSIYPMLQAELAISSVAAEFGMLSMIFLAMVKKW
ncbi:hypothetical protein [Nitrososphaera sp.]|uniref:hypothetical protein n=1 Tax=Nitrososphaera sp. TaxID=1971748 RepID=UPI001799AB88|nr:hypothetical protein [Nitrososphaera sp.]NWG38215.1 hypothetical protein [Nitrososphaera sp.]